MADSQIIITVEEMTADCEVKIRQSLERINGVLQVIVNTETKKISIEFDDEKINGRLIRETIEDEGFRVK